MSRRPDAVTSSSIIRPVVKDEPVDHVNFDEEDDDDDDPIVRTIDVFISPALSNTLHLLQFPIEPAHRNNIPSSNSNKRDVKGSYNNNPSPIEAKYRPRHNMLELEYPLPHITGHNRQLPDKMCLSSRINASNSIGLSTHMALARMNGSGTRLDVVPLRRHVLQMRPTFDHLHDNDDDDGGGGGGTGDGNDGEMNDDTATTTTKAKPIMYARKETERSNVARRSTYAHKKASETSEEWITLDVHGSEGQWSAVRKETLARVKCTDKDKTLRLAMVGHENDDEDGRGAGYVKSLNYLDSSGSNGSGAGENFVENLSEWSPSFSTLHDTDNVEMVENNDGEVVSVSSSERATAELAAKLALLLQKGNGTMIPYCVLRPLFHATKVSDDMLTVALSSCAVLVRGNFALKSTLAKFLTCAAATTGGCGGGGGVTTKLKLLRRLRDLILLLLNMHGTVGRQRLIKAFSEYDSIIDPDTITFVLKTVARQSNNCWVAKVDDDDQFCFNFPEVAACHAMYWTKKEEMLADLIDLYENAD